MNNFRLRTTIATALLLIAGVWTVGARAQSERDGGEWVRISAFTNSPLANADIVVSRPDGKVVFEKVQATNADGFYAAEIHPTPKNFRVTVIWEAKAPYQSLGMVRMSSDVKNYDRVHGVVYVNPVTTIVSRLLDRRPELDLAKAQAIVRRVLGMPANTSLGAAMREGPYYQSPVFSETEFLKLATTYGAFDGYLESLVTEAIYDPNQTHLFRASQNLGSTGFGTDAATFVAIGLANGALSWLGGQGIGWAASAAGLFTPGATKANTDQLAQKLDDLQSSVDALSNQLAQSTAQILAAINYSQYNLIAVQQLKLAAQVNVVEQDVAVLADGCPAVTTQPAPPLSKFCKSQKALVASEMSESEIHASFEEFAAALEDSANAGTKGMLHLFSLCIGQSSGHFFRYPDSIKIQDMRDYWNAVEVQAANLKVELWHLQDAEDNPAGKKELLNFLGDASQTPPTNGQLQDTQKAEGALVFQVLPQGTVVNTEDHTAWMTTLPGSNNPPSCKDAVTSPGPPNGHGGIAPQPLSPAIPLQSVANTNSLFYVSPLKEQMDSLVNGWTGANPNQWLVDQSGPKPDDPPGVTSIPFKNIIGHAGCASNPTSINLVWTITTNGNGYWVFDMNDGKYPSPNSGAGVPARTSNWLFVLQGTGNGSPPPVQYYWYQ